MIAGWVSEDRELCYAPGQLSVFLKLSFPSLLTSLLLSQVWPTEKPPLVQLQSFPVADAPMIVQDLEPPPLDEDGLEADDDSAHGESEASGPTFLRSSIVNGLVENGRHYQVMRDNDINIPSDEKQFDFIELGHIAYIAPIVPSVRC